MDCINDIGITFNILTEGKASPVDFLLKSRTLYEMIESSVAKPFKERIDENVFDLPRVKYFFNYFKQGIDRKET